MALDTFSIWSLFEITSNFYINLTQQIEILKIAKLNGSLLCFYNYSQILFIFKKKVGFISKGALRFAQYF